LVDEVTTRSDAVGAASEKGRRSGLSWWVHALAEVSVLYALIVAAEILLGTGTVGSFKVHPHPYWLIVIPMASARGVVAALVAALVGSILYGIGAQCTHPAENLDALLSFEYMLDPVLFFAVGFLVGEFRDVIVERSRRLRTDLEGQRDHAGTMKQQRNVLTEANRILEKRLVDHATQFSNLIVAAQRIEAAGRTELYEIALALIEEHCGASGSVLLPMEEGEVDFLAHRGWPVGEAAQRLESARQSDLVARALDDGVDVNGFALDEQPPESGPMAVAPLLGRLGTIEALLCLDGIPASRLNTSALRTFFSISEWITSALARLDASKGPVQETGPTEIPEHNVNWLGTSEDLATVLPVEYDRAGRYGIPLTTLTFHLADLEDTSPENLERADIFVRETFAGRVRSSDGVFRFPLPGCYVIVLPGTPLGGGGAVRTRFLERLLGGHKSPFGEVVMHVTGPDPEAPDAESLVKRMVERFREDSLLRLGGKNTLNMSTRTRVGNLTECVRRISGEVNLAMRNEGNMQVLDLSTRSMAMANPGLLALHVERVLGVTLRRSDGAYSVGPNHVAIVLPHTNPDEAEHINRRLTGVLVARDPDPLYGEIVSNVHSFSLDLPDVTAFLEAMAEVRPLEDVSVAGVEP
jgi:polysaccharide biosynthesis protein PelD